MLRTGEHVLSIPEWRARQVQAYYYLVCVNRWQKRNRYEVYPKSLLERLPRVQIPLVEPDTDVLLDIQAALEQVYAEGRYAKRVRYEQPCEPGLTLEDQAWANGRLQAFQAANRNGA